MKRYILLDFLADPRNANSRDVAIHNRLQHEKLKRFYICNSRGNGKSSAQLELFERLCDSEIYTLRRDDIPKQEFSIERIKQTIEHLKQAHEQEERYRELYRLLTESCEEYVKRKMEAELNKVWITSSNPYWEDGLIFNYRPPMAYGLPMISVWGASVESEQSDPT